MSDNKNYDGIHYATSYALRASDLYLRFPYRKYISNYKRFYNDKEAREKFGQIFKYFFYLMVQDVIEKQTTFKFPPGTRAWIEMIPISGEKFAIARKNGAFDDVDFLTSNFTGYQLYLRFNNRYGKWTKQLHVSKRYKDRITELTNQGQGW